MVYMLKFFTVSIGGMETLVRYLGVELIDTATLTIARAQHRSSRFFTGMTHFFFFAIFFHTI